jgi:hypothetical protein
LAAISASAQNVTGPPTNITGANNVQGGFVGRVSQNGAKVTYTSNRGDYDNTWSSYSVHVVDPNGANDTAVTFSITGNPAGSANDLSSGGQEEWSSLSPDGSKVVFHAFTGDWSRVSLVMIDLATGNATRLTDNAGVNDAFPTWSADGSKICFLSTRDSDHYQLYVMKAQAESAANVPVKVADDGSRARFAPDGKILFVRDLGNSVFEIFSVNPDGTGLTQVTNFGTYVSDPSMPVAGGRIFFLMGAFDGRNHVFSMKADGTDVHQVTGGNYGEDYPCAASGVLVTTATDPDNVGLGNTAIYKYGLGGATANGTVTGQFTSSGGNGSAGAQVDAYDGATVVASGTTDASGNYSLSLPPGGYTLLFTPTGTPAAWAIKRSVSVASGAVTTQNAFTSPQSSGRPYNVIPTIGNDLKVSVRWESAASAATYNVYRAASENGPWTKIKSGIPAAAVLEYVDTTAPDLNSAFYSVSGVASDGVESCLSLPGQAATNLAFNPSFEFTTTNSVGNVIPKGFEGAGAKPEEFMWGSTTDQHIDGTKALFIEFVSSADAWVQTTSPYHAYMPSGAGFVQGVYVKHSGGPSASNGREKPAYTLSGAEWVRNWINWPAANNTKVIDGSSDAETAWSYSANTDNVRLQDFADKIRPTFMAAFDGAGFGTRVYFDSFRLQMRRPGSAGTVWGRVQQKDGVGVNCLVTAGGVSARTNSETGVFALYNVPNGLVDVVISDSGSASTKTFTVANYGGACVMDTVGDITFNEDLPVTIHGTVKLASGAPVAGATVRAINNVYASPLTATTAADGSYAFTNVPPTLSETLMIAKLDGVGKDTQHVVGGNAGAQTVNFVIPPSVPFEIGKTSSAPTIDGVVNAAEWAASQPIALKYDAAADNPLTIATLPATAYAMWDNNNLYLAMVTDEPNPAGIVTTSTGHDDGIWAGDDTFTAWLDPMMADIPASGSEHWQAIFNTTNAESDIAWYGNEYWNIAADLQNIVNVAKVDTVNKKWSIEVKIPFSGMAIDGGLAAPTVIAGTKWYISLTRERSQTVGGNAAATTYFSVGTFVNTLSALSKGDLNADRMVDYSDAAIAIRIAGGLEALGARKAQGDVNNSGSVDVSDAVLILRKASGLGGF